MGISHIRRKKWYRFALEQDFEEAERVLAKKELRKLGSSWRFWSEVVPSPKDKQEETTAGTLITDNTMTSARFKSIDADGRLAQVNDSDEEGEVKVLVSEEAVNKLTSGIPTDLTSHFRCGAGVYWEVQRQKTMRMEFPACSLASSSSSGGAAASSGKKSNTHLTSSLSFDWNKDKKAWLWREDPRYKISVSQSILGRPDWLKGYLLLKPVEEQGKVFMSLKALMVLEKVEDSRRARKVTVSSGIHYVVFDIFVEDPNGAVSKKNNIFAEKTILNHLKVEFSEEDIKMISGGLTQASVRGLDLDGRLHLAYLTLQSPYASPLQSLNQLEVIAVGHQNFKFSNSQKQTLKRIFESEGEANILKEPFS